MVTPPIANNLTNAERVGDKVAKLPRQTAIQSNEKTKFFAPIKNARVYAALNAPSAFLATRLRRGCEKRGQLPALSSIVLSPNPQDPASSDLELDEVWSFVGSKKQEVYVWVALCRSTRQIVGVALGDRSRATCWRLWIPIPLVYRTGFCFTDFWLAYQTVIPDGEYVACGKDSGQTNHIERWNNTLRQRLGRFVRKTLSFSKSAMMHWICLHLFLRRYNLEIAIRRG